MQTKLGDFGLATKLESQVGVGGVVGVVGIVGVVGEPCIRMHLSIFFFLS